MTMDGAKGMKPIRTSGGGKAAAADDDDEEPLSPGARVFHEPAMNCCIVAAIGMKSELDVEVLKKGLMETLVNHPRFSSKFVVDKGKKTWVRTEVNIDDHIVIPNLDPKVDDPDQFVEDYISNLTTTLLDMAKPLWELHLLNISTSDARAIAVFKIHHSLGDGISLISLLLACTRKTSDPDSLPSLPTKKEVSNSSHENCFARCLASVWIMFKVLWNTFVDVLIFLAIAMFLRDTKTPIKGGLGTDKKRRRIVHRILSLDDIRFVKKEMNMTINDTVVGITQAGLSQYLNRKYGKGENDNLPKKIRLNATLLVNVRPTSGIQELANLMEKDSKCPWGNTIGYMTLPIHIALRDDPLDYVREAKTTIDKKKQSLEAKCTYASSKLIFHLLGEKVVADLVHRLISQTTLSFSNVVGPVEEISFYGHPIAYIAPTVYGHPHALTLHFQSLADTMTLVVGVDEEVIPDPHVLCDDIVESLSLIKNALQSKDGAHK